MLPHQFQHPGFFFRQQKGSRLLFRVPVLACSAGKNTDGSIRLLRGLYGNLPGKRHLCLGPGIIPPSLSGNRRVLLIPPVIQIQHLLIQDNTRLFLQRFPDTGNMADIHHAARPGSALVVGELSASEQRNPLSLRQRQHLLLIAKKNDSIRGSAPRAFRIGLPVQCLQSYMIVHNPSFPQQDMKIGPRGCHGSALTARSSSFVPSVRRLSGRS